jgi:hypothetical protein
MTLALSVSLLGHRERLDRSEADLDTAFDIDRCFSIGGTMNWREAVAVMAFLSGVTTGRADDKPWIEFAGGDGPGKGKHIVLVSGDEEYRSEEGLPQLAKILSTHHGFQCTVCFAIDPKDGTINPNEGGNIPGLESLAKADLLLMALRFRRLPDEQMKPMADYIESGKPIVALRTSTHAFNLPKSSTFARYTWNNNSAEWAGGFGRRVLGETWISHHGAHGTQSTRGVIVEEQAGHPILRGIHTGEIWGPSDVYGVRLPLPEDSQPLVLGQVVQGMKVNDPPAKGKQNDPMMPIAWTKTYNTESDAKARIFTTTMGASQDLLSEGLRRLIVNACYWGMGLEDRIAEKSVVDLVGPYEPTPFKFDGYKRGVKPADLQ